MRSAQMQPLPLQLEKKVIRNAGNRGNGGRGRKKINDSDEEGAGPRRGRRKRCRGPYSASAENEPKTHNQSHTDTLYTV